MTLFLVETEKPILKSTWNLNGAPNSKKKKKKNVEKEQSLKSQISWVLKHTTKL